MNARLASTGVLLCCYLAFTTMACTMSSPRPAPPAKPQPLSAFQVEFTPAGPERYPATNATEVERFKTISHWPGAPDKVSDEEKPSRPYVLVGKLHFPLAWHHLESGVSWCPAEEELIATNVRAVGGDAILLCEVTEHARWMMLNPPATVSYREITLQVIRYTDR